MKADFGVYSGFLFRGTAKTHSSFSDQGSLNEYNHFCSEDQKKMTHGNSGAY